MKQRWFVTGDKHGTLTRIWRFIKEYDLGSESNIIICGDVGIFWNTDQRDAKYWMRIYEEECNGVNLYWIDGNHENFNIIDSWHCNNSEPYKLSEHIYYCPRGLSMMLNDKKALFMGGADSIDKFMRKEGISWWPQEQITEENIKDIKGHYNYVFTHCCNYSLFNNNRAYLCTHGDNAWRDVNHTSEIMLDKLFNNITYDKHYFGHYHTFVKLNDKQTCLYHDFIELE